MTLFDAYLMVDWCANARRKTREDSVWYSLLSRTSVGSTPPRCLNPATRIEAIEEIGKILADCSERRVPTLVGFDFPYGYPSGFADALGLSEKPAWRAVWNAITARIEDHEDNSNNRFETAAEFNREVSGGPFPFWGCPRNRQSTTLTSCKVRPFSTGTLPEYRLTDRHAKGVQPVWKLFGPGCVGSQALVGIPCLARLRDDDKLSPRSAVWPFETGLTQLPPRTERKWVILYAEIFPAMFKTAAGHGETKD